MDSRTIDVKTAGGLQVHAERHEQEAERRRCLNFGISWEVSRYPVTLVLPAHAAEDRVQQLERAPSVVDEVLQQTDEKASGESDKNWPEPQGELACHFRKILNSEELEKNGLSSAALVSDRDLKQRDESILKLLRLRGAFRLAKVAPTSWRSQLNELSSRFPAFESVIDHLRGCCALSELAQCFTSIPPILLNGPPGVGKSFFAEAVAAFLDTTCVRIGFDTAQTNSALVGSADYWSNTQPGEIFKALVQGDHANPVVLVDEIDKVSVQHHDPINALLSLLESTTAKRFRDLSFPWIEIDASLITWICTSNDADSLPAPLLSRVQRFDINAPTANQAATTVEAIFAELSRTIPMGANCAQLTPAAVKVLATMTPRAARLRMQSALAIAAYHGRLLIEAADVIDNAPACGRTIGFIPLGIRSGAMHEKPNGSGLPLEQGSPGSCYE